DSMGLSNTASMALMGTLAGPWGAAVGGSVGLMMDFAAAGDDVDQMMDGLDRTLDGSTSAFAAQRQGLIDAHAAIMDLRAAVDDPSFGQNLQNAASPAFWKELAQHASDGSALYGDEIDKINEKTNKLVNAENGLYNVGLALDMVFQRDDNGAISFAIEDLAAVADRASPAMQALGITVEDLAGMDQAGLEDAAVAIADWTTNADSAAGRTRAVADAFRALDNDMVDTATSAEILEATLDSLLGPGLGLSAATDAWRDGLRNLNEELDKNNGSLFANSDAASQNRAVLRDRVTGLKDVLIAEANAGGSAGKLSGMLRKQRQALLDAGEAAGIARPQLNNYLDDLGLTPKLVKTLIKLEVKEAENKAAHIQERLDRLHAMKPSPKVDAKIEAAEAALAKVQAQLERLDGTTATTYVKTVTTHSLQNTKLKAAGGPIYGPGTPTSDSVPAMLSDGEYVIRAAAVEKYGLGFFDQANAMRLAGGGGPESEATKKARQAREEAERRREERERREEEQRQRQLDKQRTKDLLKSRLNDEAQQQNLEIRDARRRLKSAREADRPKSEVNEARLALKQEKADRNDRREQARIEAKEKRDRELADLEEERIKAAEEAEDARLKAEQERADAVLAGQERAWDYAIQDSEKRYNLAEDVLDRVKAKMDRLGEAATSGFGGSWFGGASEQKHGLWVGADSAAGDWRSKAKSDIGDLTERSSLIARLSDPALGLSGAALEDLLGNQSNAGISAMLAAGEVDDFAAFFKQRQDLLGSVSTQASMAGYGTEWGSANEQFTLMNQQFAALTAAIQAARENNFTIYETISASATVAELVRLLGNY
ncbi:MAG: hypothetical protein ABIR39_15310, partial [Nocardioides sp.]|uniref:hypothetical protein n=1 Tax=Nocardioides sp. TaxID=35761 RepID=UPI003266C86E